MSGQDRRESAVVLGALAVLLAIIVLVIHYYPRLGERRGAPRWESREDQKDQYLVPQVVPEDTLLASRTEISQPSPPEPVKDLEAKPAEIAKPAKPASRKTYVPETVSADVNIYEYIRDFYRNVEDRTLTAVLSESRLDTSDASSWRFIKNVPNAAPEMVRRFIITVDSVAPLRKYIFPGWGYGADWAPLPESNLCLECRLEGRPGVYGLVRTGQRNFLSRGLESRPDQVTTFLHSSAGYTYTLRFGIECGNPKDPDSFKSYYTEPKEVEFPAIIHFASLLGEVQDTVLIATTDPRAVDEVAKLVPNAHVIAVLFASDIEEGEEKDGLASRLNVQLYLNRRVTLPESFVILNHSKALLETQFLDPAFDRIIRSHLDLALRDGKVDENQPTRPVLRITKLISNSQRVSILINQFRQYLGDSEKAI